MERDMRLTGSLRGQTSKAQAPIGFELNNPWKVCGFGRPLSSDSLSTNTIIGGESLLLENPEITVHCLMRELQMSKLYPTSFIGWLLRVVRTLARIVY